MSLLLCAGGRMPCGVMVCRTAGRAREHFGLGHTVIIPPGTDSEPLSACDLRHACRCTGQFELSPCPISIHILVVVHPGGTVPGNHRNGSARDPGRRITRGS